ncbi:cell wall protein [Allorhizocola rhizosphaerae]|uniref:cell wall protein n=1 Tax=Allorhizocola rhizosphaerae TaxID=1872709 RepID=UPI000E3DC974|nr:cell wall protein [Allorhizocola rhizosphaerae]
MTTKLDRRVFLTAAVLTGATAVGSLDPAEAFAAPKFDVEPGAPDPNFVEGRIGTITGTMLFVTGSDGVFNRVRVTGATSVWKLTPTSFEKVAVGDGLYARGVRMADGVLAAESLWVNIVNIEAHISSIGRNVLHLEHHGSKIVAHVVPGTTATVYNGTPAISDMSLLKVGGHVKVIGAWIPDTNEIQIATVYAGV